MRIAANQRQAYTRQRLHAKAFQHGDMTVAAADQYQIFDYRSGCRPHKSYPSVRQEPTPTFGHPSEEGILCFSHPLLGGVPRSGGVGSRSEAKNDRTLFMLQKEIPAYVILDCPAGRYNHRGIRFFHNEWPAPRLFKSGTLIYRGLAFAYLGTEIRRAGGRRRRGVPGSSQLGKA